MLWVLSAAATTFTLAPASGTPSLVSSGRSVGVADLNHDGWPDLLVSASNEQVSTNQLFLQTSPRAFTVSPLPGQDSPLHRQTLVADFDGDGLRDLYLGGYQAIDVFRNNGSPSPFSDGPVTTVRGDPEVGLITLGYLNVEGADLIDVDGDRLPDVLNSYEMRPLIDPLGTPSFPYQGLGIPTGGTDDYLIVEDIDGDRFLDVAVAQEGEDLFFGGPAGFQVDYELYLWPQPDKGGHVLCDLDGDGDLDLFRTAEGDATAGVTPNITANQVWLYDSGSWTSNGSFGIGLQERTWAVDCADVDNDGDLDLAVGRRHGPVLLLRNQGNATFAVDSGGVASSAVGGLALRDLDRDGAVDLYLMEEDAPNRLYYNDHNDDDFVFLELMANLGTCEAPILVDDHHARVRVRYGNFDSGARVLSSTSGLGTAGGNPVHVGLDGRSPDLPIQVELTPMTPDANGVRQPIAAIELVPGGAPYHQHRLRSDDPDGDGVPNSIEGTDDLDGDGLGNHEDPDSDGDGLLDADEAGSDPCDPADSDGDGIGDLYETDSDGDGDPDGSDCAPTDGSVYTYTGYEDVDGDGFGAGSPLTACVAVGTLLTDSSDCGPLEAGVYPGATEHCDQVDEDCDGNVDEDAVDALAFYVDDDGDGHGAGDAVYACSFAPGLSATDDDCDDTRASTSPSQPDQCNNGIDDNCDGTIDEAGAVVDWFFDADGDGFGAGAATSDCAAPGPHWVVFDGDCAPDDATIGPGAVEVCNGIDDDCDAGEAGAIDASTWYDDDDGDGWGSTPTVACEAPAGHVALGGDCDDTEADAHPEAAEICDGIDNDCDGLLDQADPSNDPDSETSWYPDLDGDGYGAGTPVEACTPPAHHVRTVGDCDDATYGIHPGADEVADNGIDEDCDGSDWVLDRDGDGVLDVDEPPGDPDGDGLENIDDRDSDGDGVIDGAESDPEARYTVEAVDPPIAAEPDYGSCSTAPIGLTGWLRR